jgi:hypothetical protein
MPISSPWLTGKAAWRGRAAAQRAAFRRVSPGDLNCLAANNCVFCLAASLSVSLGGSPRRYFLHSEKREGQLVQQEKSAGSLAAGHSTSITCTCGEKITISLEAILSFKGAACWNCGAQLSVSKEEENRESVEALRDLLTRIDKIKSNVQP